MSGIPPFEVLFDAEPGAGEGLTDELRSTYAGDWRIPVSVDRPYVYSNFVVSHDGRISFEIPGHAGGGDVSDFNRHDQWLMGLLRSRADAVMVGAQTLRSEPEHHWTSSFIFPDDEEAFSIMRAQENRRSTPWQVFVTASGDLPEHAAVMTDSNLEVLAITTKLGGQRLTNRGITVVIAGEDRVDFGKALAILATEYDVRTLECEGGPRLYGALVAAGLIDDEFVTHSPVLVGGGRPGLIEGMNFEPGSGVRAQPISLRRAGDHLFLRSRYVTSTEVVK